MSKYTFEDIWNAKEPKKNKAIVDDIMTDIGKICLDHKSKQLANTYADYDIDEDGNIISCCGDIVDPDVMRCKSCG